MAEELPPPDGDDADGEPRPAANGADCVVDRPDPGLSKENTWDPFDDFTDGFQPSIFRVIEKDGMPSGPLGGGGDDIPVLSKDTLVCMGDFSTFVVRGDWGGITVEFLPSEVERASNGKWRVTQTMMLGKLRTAGLPIPTTVYEWYAVEPLRPPCRHYVRQLGQFSLNAEHQQLYRVCAGRRNTEGAFMSLDDTGMWACDMREPRDMATEKTMDDFDIRKIAQGTVRTYLPIIAPAADEERKTDG